MPARLKAQKTNTMWERGEKLTGGSGGGGGGGATGWGLPEGKGSVRLAALKPNLLFPLSSEGLE
jgi:hypothetical protein